MARQGEQRGCLFCRQADGGFTSEEHIFPESLGNSEYLLPVGVVCDRCNHGPLSIVNEALANFLPIEMMRTWHGIPSKTGKLPAFKFDNGTLRCVGRGELYLSLDSEKGQPEAPPAPPGRKGMAFSASRNEASPRRLRNVHRALLKMAVEFAWIDLGEEAALSSTFDHLRERVLNGRHSGYLAFPEKSATSEEIQFQYEPLTRQSDQHPVVGMLGTFWGFPIFTDSLFQKPPKPPPPGLLLHAFPAASNEAN